MFVINFIGYWMATECARDALLRKVMDNKEDAGTTVKFVPLLHIASFSFGWYLQQLYSFSVNLALGLH